VAKRARDTGYTDSACGKREKERERERKREGGGIPLVYSANPTVIDWLPAILSYIRIMDSFVCPESTRHLTA